MKTKLLFYFTLLFVINIMAQIATPITVNSYTNFASPGTEPAYQYNFAPPIYADILTYPSGSYIPTPENKYQISIFGPRHKEESSSNIGFFDFHKGTDISPVQSYGGYNFTETNPPSANSMCSGVVDEITESKGEVIVKCDSIFKADPSWGNVYIKYRHLDAIYNNVIVGQRIEKNSLIGLVGSKDASKVHLHLSAFKKVADNNVNVHPMRIFDPTAQTHLIAPLQNVEIKQLSYDQNSALFRVAIPHNQVNLRRIKLSLPGTSYSVEYDFEAIGDLGKVDRDNNSIVNGIELFAYPFNRGHKAYQKFWDDHYKGEIPAVYPASMDAPDGSFFPYINEGLINTPAYILDIKATDLPAGYNITNLEVDILDIYGYGVKANGVITSKMSTWGIILNEEEAVEEEDDGSMDMDSGDLDFEEDKIIGLQFKNINLPKGVNITKATLQFRVKKDENHSSSINLIITGQNSGISLPFIDSPKNLSDRLDTSASVSWTPLIWVAEEMGENQKVEIKPILNSLVQHSDWSENSPITLFIRTTNSGEGKSGERKAEAFDNDDLWKNAYLYIEYEPIPEEVCDTTIYQFENSNLTHYGMGGSSSITKSFTEAIENPSFTISDIDKARYSWWYWYYIDHVKVTYIDNNDIEHVYGEYTGDVQNSAEINIIGSVKSITITLRDKSPSTVSGVKTRTVNLSSITSACAIASTNRIILPVKNKNKVKFYPNPAIDFIKIISDKSYKNTTVSVRSMQGKKLLTKHFSNSKNIKLNIRTLPKKSSYILTIRNLNNKPESFILVVK